MSEPSPYAENPYAAQAPEPAGVQRRKVCPQCDMPNSATSNHCWLCKVDISNVPIVDASAVPVHIPRSDGNHFNRYAKWMLLLSVPFLLFVALLIGIQISTEILPEQLVAGGLFLAMLAFPVVMAIASCYQEASQGAGSRFRIIDVIIRSILGISILVSVGMALLFACFIAFFVFCIFTMGNMGIH